ncbi:MAG: large conductance mechanosensitive channel protein MscL [Motilibacteraceae bacterium]
MIKGFRDFILRGNVIDLAIAVVIGTAFAAVVKAVTDALITPLINAVGTPTSAGLGFSLRHTNPDVEKATFINISAIINAVIVFLITAVVVYFLVVVPMNKLMERRKRGEVPEVAATPEDVALLQEIRDILRDRSGVA